MIKTRNSVRAALIGSVALAAMSVAHGAFAQQTTPTFNIPQEDAATALAAWSAASGIKIDAPAALTKGVTTKAVSGAMDPRDALDDMIAGSKLVIIRDDGDTISLGSTGSDTVAQLNVTATGTAVAGVKAVGSPIQRLNKEDLLKTGATSLHDALATLPALQSGGGAGQDYGLINGVSRPGTGAPGPNSDGSQSVDIGGQGARATLVLVDGQRLAKTGENSASTDINQIPMSALSAVEVITDGASAIYGSDAIAGVVNLVVRKDYQGVDVSADYTKDNFTPQYGGAITIGKAWNWLQGGNALITYDYHRRQTAFLNANKFTQNNKIAVGGNNTIVTNPASATPYISVQECLPVDPGSTVSTTASAATTITVGGVAVPAGSCYNTVTGLAVPRQTIYYGLPANTNSTGATPTLAQLVSAAGAVAGANAGSGAAGGPAINPIFIPSDSYTQYVQGEKRQTINIQLQQQFSDKVDGKIGINFSTRHEDSQGFLFNNLTLSNVAVGSLTDPAVAQRLLPGGGSAGNCFPYTTATGDNCGAITLVEPYGRNHGGAIVDEISNTFQLNIAMPYNWQAKISGDASYTRDRCNSCNPGNIATASGQVAYRDYLIDQGTLNAYLPEYASPLFPQLYNPIGNDAPLEQSLGEGQVLFTGPFFNLPGGTVRGSVLADFDYMTNRKTDFQGTAYPNGVVTQSGPNASIDQHAETRDTRYAAEVNVPIFGDANALPLLKELTLDLAVSRNHAARSRSNSTDPVVGVNWKPIDDLTFRARYSKNFRAPDLQESSSSVDQFYGSAATQSDGLLGGCSAASPTTCDLITLLRAIGATDTNFADYSAGSSATAVFNLGGGPGSKNPKLKPEESTNITAGFDYKPSWLNGLSVSMTYNSLDYKNKIVNLTSGAWLNNLATANAYINYIKPLNPPSSCNPLDNTTYDPNLSKLFPDQGVRFASQQATTSVICQARILLQSGQNNVTGTTNKSASLIASYRFNTAIGTINASTNITKILENQFEASPGVFVPGQLDFIGSPISWKARHELDWSKGNYTLSLFANYTGQYTNDQQVTLNNRSSCNDNVPHGLGANPIVLASGGSAASTTQAVFTPIASSSTSAPGSCKLPYFQVPSFTTFDMSASYRTNADAPYWERNIRLSLNIDNFTDKDPPYSPNGSNVYDPGTASVAGRSYKVRVEKEF